MAKHRLIKAVHETAGTFKENLHTNQALLAAIRREITQCVRTRRTVQQIVHEARVLHQIPYRFLQIVFRATQVNGKMSNN